MSQKAVIRVYLKIKTVKKKQNEKKRRIKTPLPIIVL